MDDSGIEHYGSMLKKAAELALESGAIMAVRIDDDGELQICERDAVVGSERDFHVIAYVGVLGAELPNTDLTPRPGE